jgi:ribosomal protein L15
MGLHDLKPPRGMKHAKKRIGRGQGSGNGKTAGRGHKGAKSRSGFKFKRGFEGGQMPLHRRVPKRGFHNPFRVEYAVVNLDLLALKFEAGTVVTPELLREHGLVQGGGRKVKVLARGEVGKALTVRAHKFSGKAAEKDRRGGRQHGATRVNDSLKNLFTVSDLRKRVFFTLGLLAVYRVGHVITIPGVSLAALEAFAEQLSRNSVFGLYDMFSGGNLSKVTIFALGIMPYISASIILQLLTVVWPYLEKLSKEGELGRRKITQYTRYGTILLSIVQGAGIAIFLEKNSAPGGFHLVLNPGPRRFRMMTVLHADHGHRASSCGSASRSPSAASATACRSSSTPASSSTCRGR